MAATYLPTLKQLQSLDLAIMIRPERQKQLTFYDLFNDELMFLVSPLHPWAIAGKVEKPTIRRLTPLGPSPAKGSAAPPK